MFRNHFTSEDYLSMSSDLFRLLYIGVLPKLTVVALRVFYIYDIKAPRLAERSSILQ